MLVNQKILATVPFVGHAPIAHHSFRINDDMAVIIAIVLTKIDVPCASSLELNTHVVRIISNIQHTGQLIYILALLTVTANLAQNDLEG